MSLDKSMTITLLDTKITVKCPFEEQESLRQCAQYLQDKMHEIQSSSKSSGKSLSTEQVALLAALNITHELWAQVCNKNQGLNVSNKQVEDLSHKIEHALEDL